MVLPTSIVEPSPLDPLLLLPLPSKLPPSPVPALHSLVSALEPHLLSEPEAGPSRIPIPLLTAQMRQVTRSSQVLLNAARYGAAQAREELDLADVDLRGVEYERERVGEEIRQCGEYAPKYLEMELPDREAFLAGLSEEERGKLPDEADGDGAFEHALTIARLEEELREIKAREGLAAALQKDRDALIRSKREIKLAFDKAETYLKELTRVRYIQREANGQNVDLVETKLKETEKVAIPKLSDAGDV